MPSRAPAAPSCIAPRALGPFWGNLAGTVQIVEFVFAPPAIAMAIGAYLSQRFTGLDPRVVAIVAYLIFTLLNAWGVKQAALFELVVTVLAVAELLVFMAVVAPSFQMSKLTLDPLPHGWSGALAAVPFAIWFYLAIEGVANAAEEARNPQRDVALGFGAAIVTLMVLALGVFFLAIGVGGWRAIVYAPGSTETSDAPLPLALAQVVSKRIGDVHAVAGGGAAGTDRLVPRHHPGRGPGHPGGRPFGLRPAGAGPDQRAHAHAGGGPGGEHAGGDRGHPVGPHRRDHHAVLLRRRSAVRAGHGGAVRPAPARTGAGTARSAPSPTRCSRRSPWCWRWCRWRR